MFLTSALPPLVPEAVTVPVTGEVVDSVFLDEALDSLMGYVQTETQRLWENHKGTLNKELKLIKATSPAEAGRQAGINPNLTLLPRDVKAKSRIARLIRYSLVTNAKSYFESPDNLKREPSFPLFLNLGAVDAQMAQLNLDKNQLTLNFKVWDKEYVLHFTVPAYVLKRNITKFTLPTVRKTDQGYVFGFTIQEQPGEVRTNSQLKAGIDLGRVEPYTLAILHGHSGSLLAQYTASKRLRALTTKRDRLNVELGYLQAKSRARQSLGLAVETLETERARTRSKRNRLLNAITWQIAAEVEKHVSVHNPTVTNLEDLSWVNPRHGMSRWTHSKDQTAITHKLTRTGHKTRKVNPRNSSQSCHKCGNTITHRKGTRQVVCTDCHLVLDRDVNAAMNIAARSPHVKRNLGNNPIKGSTEPAKVVTTQSSKTIILSQSLTTQL